MSQLNKIQMARAALPILYKADIVVAGGSFAGVAAALALASAGKSVVLVEERTYLGREMTATLRPWIALPPSEVVPSLITACIEAAGTVVDGEIVFHPDGVKLTLEDQLLASGVTLLYASVSLDLFWEDDALSGIVVGNKSGRQIIAARQVIDATENGLLARLAGASFMASDPEPALYRRTLEFDGVAPLREKELPVPERLGVVENRLFIHRGHRSESHILLEFALRLPAGEGTPFADTQRETMARQISMELVAYLMHEESAFVRAYLASASYELSGLHTPSLTPTLPNWIENLDPTSAPNPLLRACAGPVANLWCLNEAVSPPDLDRQAWLLPLTSERLGKALGTALAKSAPVSAKSAHPRPVQSGQTQGLTVREPESPQRGRRYDQRMVDAFSVPVLRSADVLVVGGGTSGATAAITAARQGAHTVLVEMTPFLGGTGTYGGVHSYWFGQWVGFAAEVTAAVEEMHERLRHRPPHGPVPKWNIEAKAFSLLERATQAGVDLLTNAVVIGVIMDGNHLSGVIVTTRRGPVAVLAEVTIDATGDGDLAAMAGAEVVYGAERDHVVMWYSLAQFAKPGMTRGNFTSMVDVSNVEDYTRAILAGRRRGGRRETHDHGIYIATRESRHIRGEVVLTLNDQLLQRRWPDVVNIAFSNNDIKGHSTSDWLRMGLISPNLEIEIPYRALLPRNVENILVVGKAISATHDALPAIRMQPDLENLGGVAAMAAAQAVSSRCTPRQIDVRALQAALVDRGVLPADVLDRTLIPLRYSDDELRTLIAQLDGEKPLYLYSDMEINERFTERIPLVDVLCAGPQAIPLLEEALSNADGARRVLLTQALAALGAPAAEPVLIKTLDEHFAGDRLPARHTSIRHVQDPPDQGAMPDAAYLLYSLGMVASRRSFPIWQRVADLLASVSEEDLRNRNSGIFHYVDAVCYGIERLGDPAAIPLLTQLHSYPFLRNHRCPQGFQADYFQERQAYLEVVIGRTLARCGSPQGVILLIDYLDDTRALLAEHAHSELAVISGEDFGKAASPWGQWLEAHSDILTPMPWRQPSDPVQAWREVVLTTPAEREKAIHQSAKNRDEWV